MYLPEWALEHKEKYTEIRRIGNGYYKYQVAFVYSKEKKRTEKKTIRLLGKITEKDGFTSLRSAQVFPRQKTYLGKNSKSCPKWILRLLAFTSFFQN